jgi:hypothetical protein
MAVHTLMEVMEDMLPTFRDVHKKLAIKIVDFAERFPDKIIALARSTHALHWLNVIQAVRWIDPRGQPNAEVARKARRQVRKS